MNVDHAGRARILVTPLALAALVASLLGGCSFHNERDAVRPDFEVPERFAEGDARTLDGSAVAVPDRWWEQFGDSGLDRCVSTALEGNFDLRRAWSRIDQTEAIARQAGAGMWPRVTATAQYGRARTVSYMAEPIGKVEQTSNQWGLSLAASYEIDLWGKVRNMGDAAELDVQASRQDLESAAMSVAAGVVETWLAIVEQRANLALLRSQLALNETYLELVKLRFGQGISSALDVYQQRQQMAATRSQIPPIEGQLRVLEHQLDVLQGRPPRTGGEIPTAELPALPPLPATGLPVELLDRRPDVRAARLRVKAADHRIGVAIADQLPSLGLTASTGFSAPELGKLFESWVYTLGAALTGTLWDGGRTSAEVDRVKAQTQELVHAYSATVLGALQEVEDALVRERQQHAYLGELDEQMELAQATLAEARARYVNGLSDYLPVLTSLQALQQLERGQLTARRQLLSYRVQLHRAMGGSWTAELERPDRERETDDEKDDAEPAPAAPATPAPATPADR